MIFVRAENPIEFVRTFCLQQAAVFALMLVVLPTDPLREDTGLELLHDDEAASLLQCLAAALSQETGPGDLALAPPVQGRFGRGRAGHLDDVTIKSELLSNPVCQPLGGCRALAGVALEPTRFIENDTLRKFGVQLATRLSVVSIPHR